MATLTIRLRFLAVLGCSLVGCGKLQGLGAPVTPLGHIQVQVGGDLASVAPPETAGDTPHLRVAMVWGAQWLPEPFCILPAESPQVADVMAAGCPDSFRFVPARDGTDVAVPAGGLATLELVDLPSADVMVGDVTARVAYASLVVYDDRNGDQTLDLRNPPEHHRHNGQPPPPAAEAGPAGPRDIVYAVSFLTMTQPDQRVAFREGAFNSGVAFYPREGCEPPLPRFSLVSAGGFSPADALAAALVGQLPQEDPGSCATNTLDHVVTLTLQAPSAQMGSVVCAVNDAGGTTSYNEPPSGAPDFTRPWTCAGFPRLPHDDAGVPGGQQLLTVGPASEPCPSLSHYTLSGCDNDPGCSSPSWNVNPPSWWPCPAQP